MSEFEAGENMLKEKCQVCNKNFKLGEKLILCPIQAAKKGFINAIAIPLHTKCYWIEDDEKDV